MDFLEKSLIIEVLEAADAKTDDRLGPAKGSPLAPFTPG